MLFAKDKTLDRIATTAVRRNLPDRLRVTVVRRDRTGAGGGAHHCRRPAFAGHPWRCVRRRGSLRPQARVPRRHGLRLAAACQRRFQHGPPLVEPALLVAIQVFQAAVKNSVKFDSRFEEAVARESHENGFDGVVVCGHIHCAEIHPIGAIVYYNDGDWVEFCSALVEEADDTMHLLEWAKGQKAVHAALAEAVLIVAVA